MKISGYLLNYKQLSLFEGRNFFYLAENIDIFSVSFKKMEKCY